MERVVRFTRLRQISATADIREATDIVAPPTWKGPETPKRRLLAGLVTILCMIGVSLISYFFLIHKSLRLDESQTLWQSSHSFTGVLHVVALDVHVPLYHLFMHFWIFAFGDSVAIARLPSLLFFLATIPLIYLLARQFMPYRWALFTMVLFSFSPFMDWYANEARMYTLLALMATLSQYFFFKLQRTGKGWLAFTLTAVIGAYSHYFFMFTLATEGLYFLYNRRSFPPHAFRRFLAIGLLVIAVLSPWLYYFHSLGSASDTRPLLAKPSSVDFSNVYSQFLFGFQDNYINTILLSCWPLLMLVALVAVRRRKQATPGIGFMASMAAIPVLLAFIISLAVTPFFLSRYMISCVGPLLIVFVWLVSQYRHAFARFMVIAVVIVMALSSIQQTTSAATPVKEDYAAAVGYINQHVVPQDLVVISAPFTIYPVEYYYTGSAQIQTIPAWNRTGAGAIPAFSAKKLPAEVAVQNKNHHYIYLLLSENQGYEDTISNYYRMHFKQISHHTYSPDLTLYVYQVGYYTVPPLAQAGPAIP